ncbi:MAG: hypothetical protein FWE35_28815 [Streptosporangiales bacterium]|nr:hypothetical protein [Streptosporangiales bacterium]
MAAEHPLVRDVFPEFSAELVTLLEEEGERELSGRARDLRLVMDCGCGEDFCQSFYTAPPPDGAYGPGHRCVPLTPAGWLLVLDVVGEQIMFVEILDRPPLT